ncbi:TadE-like protein [Botrimarina colliarenosi]|uniref:TadE-like protein n=1 Tax=Botrimarina colliarenosi TaxID=2528001 RepID=A0A5C6AHZ5_9BACT|nr:TadE family protein [Botrimarina colliarenosi]TWT99614.1 TadE-like protein [Botrimarina colliarenosi]
MIRHRPASRRGATTVEFALVAPVFFLVLMAMFEFSRLNVLRHTADNAAYEAARAAIVPGATTADARAEGQRLLTVVGARGAQINFNPATITRDTQQVTVSVSIPLDRNGWVVPRFTRGKTLSSQSTLRTERVRTR